MEPDNEAPEIAVCIASAQIFKVFKSYLFVPKNAILCQIIFESPSTLQIVSQFDPQPQHVLTMKGLSNADHPYYLEIPNNKKYYLIFDAFQSMYKGLLDNNTAVETFQHADGLLFVQKCDIIEKSFFVRTYNDGFALSTPLEIRSPPAQEPRFEGTGELKYRLNFNNVVMGEAPIKTLHQHGKTRVLSYISCHFSPAGLKLSLNSQTVVCLKLETRMDPPKIFTIKPVQDDLASFFYLAQRASATQAIFLNVRFVNNLLVVTETVKKKDLIIVHECLHIYDVI